MRIRLLGCSEAHLPHVLIESDNVDQSVTHTTNARKEIWVQRHGCIGVISIRSPEKLAPIVSLSVRSLKEIMSLVNPPSMKMIIATLIDAFRKSQAFF